MHMHITVAETLTDAYAYVSIKAAELFHVCVVYVP